MGFPQGSALGPIRFLLYRTDCLNGLSSDAVLFADDVKIWRTIVPSLVPGVTFNTGKCVNLKLYPRQAKDNVVHY